MKEPGRRLRRSTLLRRWVSRPARTIRPARLAQPRRNAARWKATRSVATCPEGKIVSSRAYDYDAGVDTISPAGDAAARREDTRVFGLVRRLAEEITTLFTKELALLKV